LCGAVLGHFRVHEQIGRGGMGSVYRADDLHRGREVALKVLSAGVNAERTAIERFRRECRVASSLIHPNICAVYEVGEAGGLPFIAMELLQGQTIHQSIFRQPATGTNILDDTPFLAEDTGGGRAFDMPALFRISREVLLGLEAAHAREIVHRDIKPANIFLTRQGAVKILDFGLAKKFVSPHAPSALWQTDGITKAGSALGTLTYMSPEQIRGERLDSRTDLFSLGAVMFEMATGRRAFEGRFLGQVLDAIINGRLPAVHDVRAGAPDWLSAFIFKAVEPDRERRYQSARDMRLALEQAMNSAASRAAAWK
jgi:serine/threonine protein kinase